MGTKVRNGLPVAVTWAMLLACGGCGLGESDLPSADSSDDLPKVQKIDPALIHYEQTGAFPVEMQQVHALAVGPEDRIYVGGDKAVFVFGDSDGTRQLEIALDDEPTCLAVGNVEHAFPGRIYVGFRRHLEVFDADGKRVKSWDTLGEKAQITSIAADEEDVFVADAGNRIVLRYGVSGELIGRIGRRDDRRQIPGFVITSTYFDLAVSPDGLLRVVNPRLLRLEAYTFDGDLEHHWGESASSIEGFFGCCNPAHFAVLSDGRFVTAEKGVARIKVYDSEGRFESVVAGPEQLPVEAADLTTDSRGRILVLDPKAKRVRIFGPKATDPETQP